MSHRKNKTNPLEGIYLEAYQEGERAPLDAENPYSISLLGRRCAWFAGYWDSRDQKTEQVKAESELSGFW